MMRRTREKTYLSVQQRHVLDISVFNHVHHPRILPDTAHADPVRVVAPQVLHEDVGGVGLGREAVITAIDTDVGHANAIHVPGVKAVRIFSRGL